MFVSLSFAFQCDGDTRIDVNNVLVTIIVHLEDVISSDITVSTSNKVMNDSNLFG